MRLSSLLHPLAANRQNAPPAQSDPGTGPPGLNGLEPAPLEAGAATNPPAPTSTGRSGPAGSPAPKNPRPPGAAPTGSGRPSVTRVWMSGCC
mmetsp:Transcript_62118/g.102549  ORF Transcript_62118/g.102549 Transcript_62118/m.102549 type:complete len:92 (-) Transcript_62118:623-898(-)